MLCEPNEINNEKEVKMEDDSSLSEKESLTLGNSKTQRSTWTMEQLFDTSNATNPAWTALRSAMRSSFDQQQLVDGVQSKNFKKAVTQVMNEFAALKPVIDDQTSRDIVGSLMIANCHGTLHKKNRELNRGQRKGLTKKKKMSSSMKKKKKLKAMKEQAATNKPTKLSTEKEHVSSHSSHPKKKSEKETDVEILTTWTKADSPGKGHSTWTSDQLLNPTSKGNAARKKLMNVMKIVSNKRDVVSVRSRSYQLAITEVMNEFEALKPLIDDVPSRTYIGQSMMSNKWRRQHRERAAFNLSKKSIVSSSCKAKMVPKKKKEIINEAPSSLEESPAEQDLSQELEGFSSDQANATSGIDEVSEEDTDQDKSDVPTSEEERTSKSLEELEYDTVLSDEANKLMYGHSPMHEWQRLKKMMRLSSDALGLVGLQQEKSLHTIKQILADFPQLMPYVDNVAIQKKLQKQMLVNLRGRIKSDQKRLAEFFIKNDVRKKHLKQTSLMSRVRKLTDISALNNTQKSKLPSPRKLTSKKTVSSLSSWCLGRPHPLWMKRQVLSKDSDCPAWQHLVRTMQVTAKNLNVTYKSCENYDAAVSQVMNHFAALQPLVNIHKYREIIGKRMVKIRTKTASAKVSKSKRERRKTAKERRKDDVKDTAPSDEENDEQCLQVSSVKKEGLQREAEHITGKGKGDENTLKESKVKLKTKVHKRKLETNSEDRRNRKGDVLSKENTCNNESNDFENTGVPRGKGVVKLLKESDEEGHTKTEEEQREEAAERELSGEDKDAAVSKEVGHPQQSNKGGNMKLTMKRLDDYLFIRKKRDVENNNGQSHLDGEDRAVKEKVECKANAEQQREESERVEETPKEEKTAEGGKKRKIKDDRVRVDRLKRKKKKFSEEKVVVDLTEENDENCEERKEAGEDEEHREGTKPTNERKISNLQDNKTGTVGKPRNKGKLKRRNTFTVKVNALCMVRKNTNIKRGLMKRDEIVVKEERQSEDLEANPQVIEPLLLGEPKTGDKIVVEAEERSRDDPKDDEEDKEQSTAKQNDEDGQVDEIAIEDENCEKQGREKHKEVEENSEGEGQSEKDEQAIEDFRNREEIQEKEQDDEEEEGNNTTKENDDDRKQGDGEEGSELKIDTPLSPLEAFPTLRDLLMNTSTVKGLCLSLKEKMGESGKNSQPVGIPPEMKSDENGAEEGVVNKESQEKKITDYMEEKQKDGDKKNNERIVSEMMPRKNLAGKMMKGQRDPKKEPEIFEVDTILKYAQDREGGDWYYVKWLGYASDQNTWEPLQHLSGCSDLLKKFHRQLKRVQQKQQNRKRKLSDDGLVLGPKKPKVQKQPTSPVSTEALQAVVREELKNWTISLNCICTDTAPIVVENDVDFEGPPTDFTYINDYISGTGVTIPNDPLVGCDCTKCSEEEPECCPQNSGVKFAYNRLKHIRVKPGTPIYECNKYCKCGEDCPNRVVQLGRKYPMSIFRTSNSRGWGVKTLVDIRRSTFVMEYVGEVITNEEAERRGKEYDANGRTYLFDLDYNDDDCPFTVDAGKSGNISHFVNHSCEPNLVVYGVWVNCVDPRLPRIALFANRDIKAGEELTFDYQMTGEVGDLSPDVKVQHVACRCGAENCRGYLV